MVEHTSDCAVNNAPAYPPAPCDCGAFERLKATNVELVKALEQAQRALDGVVRSAGQSTAGFLAGRRQVAKAKIAAGAALAKAKEPTP